MCVTRTEPLTRPNVLYTHYKASSTPCLGKRTAATSAWHLLKDRACEAVPVSQGTDSKVSAGESRSCITGQPVTELPSFRWRYTITLHINIHIQMGHTSWCSLLTCMHHNLQLKNSLTQIMHAAMTCQAHQMLYSEQGMFFTAGRGECS